MAAGKIWEFLPLEMQLQDVVILVALIDRHLGDAVEVLIIA